LFLWKSIHWGNRENGYIRIKERDVRLKHVTQLILSEYNIETSHDKTITIATTISYFPKKYMKAKKIETSQ